MALRWLVMVTAAAVLAGCMTRAESDAALFGFCTANVGALDCDQGVCPCEADLPDAGFVCVAGKCQRIDGDTCFGGAAGPKGQLCGCSGDCASAGCVSHHCQ
jgi:hypothetical protein